ncbi:PEP-CTERM sorting domain-containing protein [Methylomonas rivi]|uniref:PEP-CTERM sorting domain-containing protein n=1 Tax=Methylomonas rivi TaxID=2952226 RepID=A0ABT1U7L3_9GAMM|nr:PEP-CTERM sorting domain-containing protein [Methylomonas sp. WSC-6]MCQ8129626.1 PEP-CTERM sorting domain-containing protein [Methylomonas sp. WSC-6]
MNKPLGTVCLTATLWLAMPNFSSAATLGLTTSDPILGVSSTFFDYFEFAPDGDLSTFLADVDSASGISTTGFTTLDLGIGFSLADPTTGATGGFGIYDDTGLFLSGDLLAVGFTENIIELQFNNLTGTGAGSFGTSILALINFDDPLGPEPFAGLVDGSFYSSSVSVANVQDPATVPVPPTLLLLASGLFGMGWAKKRCLVL